MSFLTKLVKTLQKEQREGKEKSDGKDLDSVVHNITTSFTEWFLSLDATLGINENDPMLTKGIEQFLAKIGSSLSESPEMQSEKNKGTQLPPLPPLDAEAIRKQVSGGLNHDEENRVVEIIKNSQAHFDRVTAEMKISVVETVRMLFRFTEGEEDRVKEIIYDWFQEGKDRYVAGIVFDKLAGD